MAFLRAPLPLEPSAANAGWRRALWLLPLLTAAGFALLVVAWAHGIDADEREAFRRTLEADVASVEAQLLARQDAERARLREISDRLAGPGAASDAALAAVPGVAAGLQRLWNRVVWLDADQQVLARAERRGGPDGAARPDLLIRTRGQAQHLRVEVPGAGAAGSGWLLARYELSDLLGSTDWVWLNRRYEVEFLSELREVIATTAGRHGVPSQVAFERRLAGTGDVSVVLRPFQVPLPWWQRTQTVLLLAGLLVLGAAGSWLLRGQMQRVQRAVVSARHEAAWRQSMEDSALVGLRARDLEGRILYVNRTLCEMVGYTREELVGLVPPLPFWPADAIDAMMARNLDTLAGGAPASGYETRWIHRDGGPLDVMIFESRLFNSEGEHVGWMGSIVDISARKQLEERERRHVEQVAQHARLNDLGLLASELAHELNQPLTAVMGYSAGLLKWVRTHAGGESAVVEAAMQVQEQARRAGDIVHWIRRQTQRKDPQRRPEDLNAVVRAVCDLRAAAIRRQGVALTCELAPGLPPVSMERVGIEQVLTNLLRNAADALAGQPGPRQVAVRTGAGDVAGGEGGEGGEGGAAWVEVADNGPGVQGLSLEALCAPFYTTKDKSTSLGLGLGICREIVEAHGGALSLAAAPEGGALFRFTLPAAPSAPSAPAAAAPPPAS
ncbi:sensor histidine kinase [Ramlibacter sp. MAHUQ-53]|uniref:sensor histidine kinase n=1 Tax=unclassified Ramlibacter TaxID=2617605 RepID=UPI00363B4213